MKNKAKFLFFVYLWCGLFSFAFSASAQQKDLKTLRDDEQSDGYVGVALVIGNANYKHATKLNSPVNDAGDVAKTLSSLDFKVLNVNADATFEEMDSAVADFGRELSANKGVGIFYYSGHGVQSNGKNYLIPVDANITLESFLSSRSLDTEIVLRTMAAATNKLKIVILDACRNNPFAKSWSYKGNIEGGLAGINSAPKGTLIAYATSPYSTASDGNGRNSPYTEVLLKEMVKPEVRITEMFENVGEILLEQTNGGQVPWKSNSPTGRFCLAGCTTMSAPQPNNPLSRIKQAEEFFNQGVDCASTDYDCKISNYSKAINLNPKYDSAYIKRAISYFYKKDYDTAVRDYTKAIELNPKFADAYYGRGNAYLSKQDYDAAIRDYTKAIELDPKNTNVYYNRAISYKNKQDYNTAIQDYNKAIKLKPNFVLAYNNRGVIYYDKQDYDSAILDFSKAIESDSKFAGAYYNRGNAYFDKQDYDTAIRDYTKATELNPKYAEAYYNCGNAYLNKQDYDTAIRDYSKAIELNLNEDLVYYTLFL